MQTRLPTPRQDNSNSQPAPPQQREERLRPERALDVWVAVRLCALVALPIIVLWPYRSAACVADDIFFAAHFSVRSWTDALFGAWPHGFAVSHAWRPMVVLTYWASAAWSNGQPESYHLFNNVVHGVNAMLLALLVRRVSREWGTGLLAGALFAVHPIVNENVIWVSGRTFPIAALFGLALCVWSVDAPARRAWLQHAIGVLLLVAALASYEFSVVLPVVIVVLAAVVWPATSSTRRGLTTFALPYVATLVVYLLFRWLWLSSLSADVLLAARASQWIVAPPITHRVPRNVLFFTLRLLAWPWFETDSEIRVGATGVVTSAAALVAVVVLAARPALRKAAIWWLMWIALWFAPVIAYGGFSDRFGYLSAAGLAALIATAAAALWRSGETPRADPVRRGLVAAVILALLVSWTRDLRTHGLDWLEAGTLATRIVDQVLALEPAPAQPVSWHFIGVPRRYGSALVFITYFPLAVVTRYPEPARINPQFHLWWEPEAVVLRQIQANPGDLPVRVYRWDPQAARLEPVWHLGSGGGAAAVR